MVVVFDELTICLDMCGCPNRCKHCWIGHQLNGNLNKDDLRNVAKLFETVTNKMTVYSWLREPDYHKEYQDLWELEKELSFNSTPQRFELLSFYRIVRDPHYLPWAVEQGVRKCQLTFFGLEELTDKYVGRKGAFFELLEATELLLTHQIAPRWQVFVNQENINELDDILKLSEALKLKERCQEFGAVFEIFAHQGSCDGENEKLYHCRLTDEELKKIPKSMLKFNLGYQESQLVKKLSQDSVPRNLVVDKPVFFVSSTFEVYPNISNMASWWSLGNLKQEGIETIMNRYLNNESMAQKISASISPKTLVKLCGDDESRRLFDEEDYYHYLINQYFQRNSS